MQPLTRSRNRSRFPPRPFNLLSQASLRLRFSRGEIDPRVLCGRTTTGTFFDGSGVLQTAAIGVPRLTYNPADLSLSPGLLAEEARANDFLNTAVLSTQSITVTNAQRTVSFYGSGTLVLSGATSATLVGSAAPNVQTVHTFTPTAGTLTATVTGSVLRAQCEIGASASSYIPTTTTAITRGADNLRMTDLSWYQQSGGVLYVDYGSSVPIISGTSRRLVALSDGTANNRIVASFGGGGVVANFFVTDAGVAQVNIAGVTMSLLGGKVATRIATDNYAYTYNGGAVFTDTSASVPVVNQMRIGWVEMGSTSVGINTLNGIIREIAFIPNTAISDSALQQLTRP